MADAVSDLQERVKEREKEIETLLHKIKHEELDPGDYKTVVIRLRFLRNSYRILKGKLCRQKENYDITRE